MPSAGGSGSAPLWTLLELFMWSPTNNDFAHRTQWETTLLYDLLALNGPNKYDNREVALKPPINVQPLIHVEHMEALEEKQQVMTMHGMLMLTWKDSRLKWNASAYGDIHRISKTRNYLKSADLEPFIPKIFATEMFYRTADLLNSDSAMVSISHYGQVTVSIRLQIRTSCHFFFDKYPNDVQNCSFTIYTPMTMSQLIFILPGYTRTAPKKADLNVPFYSGQWLWWKVNAKPIYLLPGLVPIEDPNTVPRSIVRSVAYYNFQFKRIDVFYNTKMANPVWGISIVLYAFSIIREFHVLAWLSLTFVVEILIVANMRDGLPIDYDNMPAVAFVMALVMFETIIIMVWRIVYLYIAQRPGCKMLTTKMNTMEYWYKWCIPVLVLYNYYMVYLSFL